MKITDMLKNFKPQPPDIKKILSAIRGAKKKHLIFGSLILVAVIVFVWVTTQQINKTLFKSKEALKKTSVVSFEDESIPIKAYSVKRIDFKDTLPVIGNIKGFKEIDLKFQVAGILENFNFEEGERIQEGDIIASLIQKDALLKLKYAEIEYSKAQKLFEIGAINQMKVDQGKLEYDSAKSELDKTNIYATTNGFLGSRVCDVGSYVTPNDKVGVFVQSNKVYAEFNVIEKDVPKIELGQKAEVYVDAFPTKSLSGTVDRIAPIIEGRSRTEVIKIEIANKDGVLKPGMFARALISTYEKKDDLVIPASALKKVEADYFVYVVHKEEIKQEPVQDKTAKEKKPWWGGLGGKKAKAQEEKPALAGPKEAKAEYGTIEVRKVKPGYMTQDLIEISSGVSENEIIVVEVQEEFKDKTKVEIAEVQEGLL